MPVYFVVYLNITNPDRFMEYYQTVMPVIERRGGRIVGKGVPETLEGNFVLAAGCPFPVALARGFA